MSDSPTTTLPDVRTMFFFKFCETALAAIALFNMLLMGFERGYGTYGV